MPSALRNRLFGSTSTPFQVSTHVLRGQNHRQEFDAKGNMRGFITSKSYSDQGVCATLTATQVEAYRDELRSMIWEMIRVNSVSADELGDGNVTIREWMQSNQRTLPVTSLGFSIASAVAVLLGYDQRYPEHHLLMLITLGTSVRPRKVS